MNFGHKQFQSVGVVETLDTPLALVCHFLPTRNKAIFSKENQAISHFAKFVGPMVSAVSG